MLINIHHKEFWCTRQLHKGPGNSWVNNSSHESVWFIFKGLSYYPECKGWKEHCFIDVETVHLEKYNSCNKYLSSTCTGPCLFWMLVIQQWAQPTRASAWWSLHSSGNKGLFTIALVSPEAGWETWFSEPQSCDHSIIPQFRKTV